MSRAAMTFVAVWLLTAPPLFGRGRSNPHLDRAVVREGCSSCHSGHGNSQSPMLNAVQNEACLACHGGPGPRHDLGPDAEPAPVARVLAKAFAHPLTSGAYTREQSRAVVCTSCHSPHRSALEVRPVKPDGRKYRAGDDPTELENDMCLRCHGAASRFDVKALVDPANRSYHPIIAPSPERSRSVGPELSGREINCTDCHGNSDEAGPRGPHGSDLPSILRKANRQQDGPPESKASFDLCYSCHDRDLLLDRSSFPQHREHIIDERTACSTCHNAHGSVQNRMLIRFGGEAGRSGVLPSSKTGKLAFVSSASGSGACYLNCHGEEHGPKTYGSAKLVLETADPLSLPVAGPQLEPLRPASPGRPDSPLRPGTRVRPQ